MTFDVIPGPGVSIKVSGHPSNFFFSVYKAIFHIEFVTSTEDFLNDFLFCKKNNTSIDQTTVITFIKP